MSAKVAEYNVNTDVRTHRDGVRVHQAAGGVLRVGEHFLNPLPVLFVHGLQDFLDDRIRQLLQQVRQVVGFEILDDVGQFLGVQLAQEVTPDIIAEILENLALQLFVYQVPEQGTLAGRRGFEQMGNITGAQATVQDAGNLFQCATVQGLAQ